MSIHFGYTKDKTFTGGKMESDIDMNNKTLKMLLIPPTMEMQSISKCWRTT